jgi:hypothetical protein
MECGFHGNVGLFPVREETKGRYEGKVSFPAPLQVTAINKKRQRKQQKQQQQQEQEQQQQEIISWRLNFLSSL